MKLTEEEKQKVLSKWNELINRVTTRPNQDIIDLVEWVLSELSQLPENATQWIHCSERLPTKEDANSNGEVWVNTPYGYVSRIKFHALSHRDNMWWATPIEELKKPTPPDPFEEWLRGQLKLTEQTKNLLKEAYELGRKNPKEKA